MLVLGAFREGLSIRVRDKKDNNSNASCSRTIDLGERFPALSNQRIDDPWNHSSSRICYRFEQSSFPGVSWTHYWRQ